jgi:hypothetical protein
MLKRAALYALVYAGLSLGAEVVLLVVFRLRVPQDNRIIAPVVLVAPPVAAAWRAQRRMSAATVALAVLTSALTVVSTVIVTRATGKSVGLLEPMLARPLAGFLAALATRLPGGRGVPGENGAR